MLEVDERMIREAAHLMVSSLAGSLALVTCREPLRVSLTSHLRSLLNPSGSSKDVRPLFSFRQHEVFYLKLFHSVFAEFCRVILQLFS